MVAAVAIFALRNPKTDGTKAGQTTAAPHTSQSSHAGQSSSPARSSSPAPTSQSTTFASSPPQSSGAPASSTDASGTDAAGRLPLVVLNNTTITGLAKSAADRFTAAGWTVSKYDNYQNDIISTAAYYDPDVPGAQAAAQALQQQFPTIQRVVPQFAELGVWNSPVVVILTPGYQP